MPKAHRTVKHAAQPQMEAMPQMPVASQPMRMNYQSNSQVNGPYSLSSMLSFLNNNAGLLFLGAAVFAIGFLSGSMYRENSMLKKGIAVAPSAVAAAPAAAAPAAAAPEAAPGPLSDADWQEAMKDPAGVIGNKDAKLTMVEFTDYQCPFCGRHYTETHKTLMEKYVSTGKMKIVFRDQALPFHPNAKNAAQAARCAGEKGKFTEMHDQLFANQAAWSDLSNADAVKKYGEYADKIGISGSDLMGCITANKYAAAVDSDGALGSRLGANGTPTFFIDKEIVVGAQPISAFQAIIDQKM